MTAWSPQPGPQAEAIAATWCDELFFGGARGGGKSDFILGDYLQDVGKYGHNWQGILFRKSYPELSGLILRSHSIFGPTGAEWKEGKHQWQWPNGAILRFRHLESDNDAQNYQGHQYPWIGFDELGNWATPTAYKMLFACRRWAEADVPTKRIRSTGNPGGVGHQWIQSMFIDIGPKGYEPHKDDSTGWWRMYIPSRVTDNRILLRNDPGYVDSLRGVGSPELVRAWLEGDWNAIAGAYFAEFSIDKHVIAPFEIPEWWLRFRAFDWGYSAPYCCLWFAVSDGSMPGLPVGALVVYRELYGASEPNVGIRQDVKEVAEAIRSHEMPGETISWSVADPAIFKHDGGPSIAEEFTRSGIVFTPADNVRIAGWQQVRRRLIGNDGVPMAKLFSTCKHLIRTLPALQHDTKKPEDLDTNGEDHAADTFRYGCMSRPYHRNAPKQIEPIRGIENATLNEIWKHQRPATKRW